MGVYRRYASAAYLRTILRDVCLVLVGISFPDVKPRPFIWKARFKRHLTRSLRSHFKPRILTELFTVSLTAILTASGLS